MQSLWLLLGIAAMFFEPAGCSLAAMSIDLGTQFIKVGLVKPGVPMEIVLNKESRRKTPNLLSIRNGERLFGDAALAVNVRYPNSVYGNLLDLVSKNIDHPSVSLFKKRFPHLDITKSTNSSFLAAPFGNTTYSVETLVAMILGSVRDFTEAYAEQPVKDVVITVPTYFSQAERLSIERAAQMANLNLLQILNDGTAVGLNYGVFRRKEITETAQRLLIYDMGSAKTTATIVEFKLAKEKYGKEPKMTVLGLGYDRTLGGLEVTLRLQDRIVQKFRENYKTDKDITSNPKAMAKMLKESERVKQVLSANVDHYAQIESVHEDKDMRIKVTRDELNNMIADLEPRVAVPIQQALAMSNLKIEEIDQVVLMGAGTRVPKLQEAIQKAVGGKELGRFLNTDESAAMGALFQAAHLSKGFKVKPFNVDELVIFPVQVNFISKQKQENGDIVEKPISRQIFQYKTHYPTTKKSVSFTSYTDDFNFELNYGDLKHFNAEQNEQFAGLISNLSTISVTGLAKALEDKFNPEETDFKGVKVAFHIDGSGIVRVGKAEVVIHRKSQGVVESIGDPGQGYMSSITNTISGFFSSTKEEGEPETEEKKDTEAETLEADPVSNDAEPQQQAQSDEAEKKVEDAEDTKKADPEENKEKSVNDNAKEVPDESTKESEKEPAPIDDKKNGSTDATKKKEQLPEIVKVALKTTEVYTTANLPSQEDVDNSRKILEAFGRVEKLAAERAAAENELEAYAFEASLLNEDEEFIRFSTEDEREKLRIEVTRVRSWLEDEANPQTKTGEFKENYNAINDIVRPIKRRISESQALPVLISNLESMLNSSKVFVGMGGDDEKSLFKKNDTEAFGKKLDKLETWLNTKKASQAAKKDNEDPALLSSEIDGKIKALDRELKSFMNKMKSERTINLKKEKKKEKSTKDNTTEKKEESSSEKAAEKDEKKSDDLKPEDTKTEL